jgi:hypothetical protein
MQRDVKESWGSFPNDDKSLICKTITQRLQGKMSDQEWQGFFSSLDNAAKNAPQEDTANTAKVEEGSRPKEGTTRSTSIDAIARGERIIRNSRFAPQE